MVKENQELSFAQKLEQNPRLREYVEKTTELWKSYGKGELNEHQFNSKIKELEGEYGPRRTFREWLEDNI